MDWSIQKLDYWEKTDCYYYAANDALILHPFAFEKGYLTDDGIVRLYYYNEIYRWPFIVTLHDIFCKRIPPEAVVFLIVSDSGVFCRSTDTREESGSLCRKSPGNGQV